MGALGSRRTQAARRDWLTEFGVSAADQDRVHGPAGLDIDAHTPAEIAISIVAEIVAGRSSAGGGALRDRSGPVHVDGVHAPPPRYARSAADQQLAEGRQPGRRRVPLGDPLVELAAGARPIPCSQPGRHCTAPSSRSGKAHNRSSAVTWARPNDRTPGRVDHPASSSGSRSATADDDVCRPLPIALTSPVAR